MACTLSCIMARRLLNVRHACSLYRSEESMCWAWSRYGIGQIEYRQEKFEMAAFNFKCALNVRPPCSLAWHAQSCSNTGHVWTLSLGLPGDIGVIA